MPLVDFIYMHLMHAVTLLKIATRLVHDVARPWIYLYFVTFWGLILDHFTLKIAELRCNLPLRGYPLYPQSSTPGYIYTVSACGVDKKDLKWWEIQLAVRCGESSLIATVLNSYRFTANYKPSVLSLLEILHALWIIELRISQYLSM